MNVIYPIIILVGIIIIFYLVYKLYSIKNLIKNIPVTTISIGTRINFTGEDELQIAGATGFLSMIVKLLDQEISISVSELSSIHTKGYKVPELQGKIEGFIHLRGRLQSLKNQKTDK